MGVSISPGGASWSYAGFHEFRCRLAKAEGFDLNAMKGFKPSDMPDEEWRGRSWDEVHSTLVPLLNHPDKTRGSSALGTASR